MRQIDRVKYRDCWRIYKVSGVRGVSDLMQTIYQRMLKKEQPRFYVDYTYQIGRKIKGVGRCSIFAVDELDAYKRVYDDLYHKQYESKRTELRRRRREHRRLTKVMRWEARERRLYGGELVNSVAWQDYMRHLVEGPNKETLGIQV